MNKSDRMLVVDGEFVNSEEPVSPATSRGLMYGDGCFETFCAYKSHFFKLTEHLDRLHEGLDYLNIDYPADFEIAKLNSMVKELLNRNNLHNKKAVVRLQVWREGYRGYATDSTQSHYSIICTEYGDSSNTYHLATVDTKRISSLTLPSKYKFTNGLNYIRAAQEARAQDADDALMETVDGHVSETTIANIFWLKDNTVYTPSQKCDILPGITRQVVLELLRNQMNMEVIEGEFKIDEVKSAEAVWVCNSVKEILPVSQIDEIYFTVETSVHKEMQVSFKAYLNKQLSTEA